VNGNVKLGRAAARSGEWAQHFSNASCRKIDKPQFKNTEILKVKVKNAQYKHKDNIKTPPVSVSKQHSN